MTPELAFECAKVRRADDSQNAYTPQPAFSSALALGRDRGCGHRRCGPHRRAGRGRFGALDADPKCAVAAWARPFRDVHRGSFVSSPAARANVRCWTGRRTNESKTVRLSHG